jgi:hypothetical protein
MRRPPPRTKMGDLVRLGQARARLNGAHIGRPNGRISRPKAHRDWRWAVKVDNLIDAGKWLKEARWIVAKADGVHIRKIERAHQRFNARTRAKTRAIARYFMDEDRSGCVADMNLADLTTCLEATLLVLAVHGRKSQKSPMDLTGFIL